MKKLIDIKTKEGAEKLVLRARTLAPKLVSRLENATGARRREMMADLLLQWMLSTSPGYLSSDIIESVYLDIASNIHTSLYDCVLKNTGLFVMTFASISGGHTRWVEQWIECDKTRSYSLVLTEPISCDLPIKLVKSIVNRGGKILCLGDDDRVNKAKKLRKIASEYEVIFLSLSMDDTIPLLAFGTSEFTRPIALLNHANHMFWIGMSIADRIIDCGNWQQSLSVKFRGVQKTYMLPWLEFSTVHTDDLLHKHAEARHNIGLSSSRFMVLTAAGAYKYSPVAGYNFTEVIKGMLEACSTVEFYTIGVTKKEMPNWAELENKFNGRLHFLPFLPFDEFATYCYAADLYIDSFPFTSGGTVGVAQKCGCPAITLCTEFNYPKWMRCDGVNGLISRAVSLVNTPQLLDELHTLTFDHVIRCRRLGERSYCEPIYAEFMKSFSKEIHAVHKFSPVMPEISMNDYVILGTRYNKKVNDLARISFLLLSCGPDFIGLKLLALFKYARKFYIKLKELFCP